MASYKFPAILAFLVAVSVIQSARAQAQGANSADMASMPGLTADQYNTLSASIRNIVFQMYQSMMALMPTQATQAAASAATSTNQA